MYFIYKAKKVKIYKFIDDIFQPFLSLYLHLQQTEMVKFINVTV